MELNGMHQELVLFLFWLYLLKRRDSEDAQVACLTMALVMFFYTSNTTILPPFAFIYTMLQLFFALYNSRQ